MLFTLLIYKTFHDFPYPATLVSLPNATKNKNIYKHQYIMWCRHFTQFIPQCTINAQIVTIYVCRFPFSVPSTVPTANIYLNKIPFHVGCKVSVHYCSSTVVVVVVAVVVVVVVTVGVVMLVALVIMKLVVFLFFGGCGGCSGGGCGGGNGSISSNNNSSSTTDLSFFLYINLQLCDFEL